MLSKVRYREHFYTSKVKELKYDDFVNLIKEPQRIIKVWRCFKKIWKEKPDNTLVDEYFKDKLGKLHQDEYYQKYSSLDCMSESFHDPQPRSFKETCKIGTIKTELDENKKSISYGKWISILFYEYPVFRVVSQCYTIDDEVKPYFDFDKIDSVNVCLDNEQGKMYLDMIKQILNKEFGQYGNLDIVYASNHRQIIKNDEVAFKYSYHVMLNGIRTTVKYLSLFVDKLNYELGHEFFDPSIYNATGIFRISNQKKSEEDINDPILSHHIENYIIHNISNDAIEYKNNYKQLGIIDTVNELVSIKTQRHRKKNSMEIVDKGVTIFDEDAYTATPQQLKNLQILLFDLPEMYYTLYKYWRNICFALKHYSNSKAIYDIFDEFSRQSHNYGGISALWNSTKNNKGDNGEKGNNYTLGSLIKIHRNLYNLDLQRKKDISFIRNELEEIFKMVDTIKNEKDIETIKIKKEELEKELEKLLSVKGVKKINYGSFHKYEDYDELEGLDLLKIEPEIIDKEYICEKETYKPFVKIYPKKLNLIKSATGTGKTTFIQKCIIEKNKGMNIISITSRRSLALVHADIFDLTYYENGKEKIFYENISLQLDSLNRLGELKGNYILILDEINSLTRHLLNGMDKMRSMRLIFTDKLMKLINNSYLTLGVDADISTYVLNFIKSNINRNICLTINKYRQIFNIPIKQYLNMHCLVDVAKNIKKGGDNFVVLSDSKKKLEGFVEVLKKEGIIKDPFEILDDKGNFKGLVENDKMRSIYINLQEKFREEILNVEDNNKLSDEEKNTAIEIIRNRKQKEFYNQPDEIKYGGLLLLYTGETGDQSDFSNVDLIWKWNDIGCSPTLLYGISYNLKYTHHVICLYFNKIEMSADMYMQQIARVRHPMSISIFVDNYCEQFYYESKNDLIEYYKLDNKVVEIGKVCEYDWDILKRIESLCNFFYDESYHVYKYKCLQYYLPKLLNKKGFINYEIIKENEFQTKYIFSKIEKDIIEICSKFGNDQLNNGMMVKYKKRMEKYRLSIDSDMEDLKFVFDEEYSNALYAYFEQKTREYINKYDENRNDTLSFNSLEKKLLIMDKLHKKLKVKWWNVDFSRDYKKDDIDIEISNSEILDIKKAFRVSNKVKIDKTYNNLYRRLLTCYNNIFKVCFKNCRIYDNENKKQIYCFVIKRDVVMKMDNIFTKCYIQINNYWLRK